MRNARKPGRRRNTCLSDLVQRFRTLRSAGSLLLICYLLSTPALLGSCRKLAADSGAEPPEVEEPAIPDSAQVRLRIIKEGQPVRRLDLFCYSDAGTQPLEVYRRFDNPPDTLILTAPKGRKRLVAIANSPHSFNLVALGRYDTIRQLSFGFSDDDPAAPILGGCADGAAPDAVLRLTPLLCRITLASVANTMDGYELLEDPRVRLRDLPDEAEILRTEEFRPSQLIDAGTWTALPFDVGYFPQQCGIDLWCYPNDTPEDILGTPRPSLEFECRIRGESCTFEVPLPPLPRACTKEVELIINGPGDYHYRIR